MDMSTIINGVYIIFHIQYDYDKVISSIMAAFC